MFTTYFFDGRTSDVALVIAGVHGSELSGIEVAHWIRVKLQARQATKKSPFYTTVVVPEVFPEQANIARNLRRKMGFAKVTTDPLDGRYPIRDGVEVEPNRQFPPPGNPLSYFIGKTSPTDSDGSPLSKNGKALPLLPETRELMRLIELSKPVRIASVHAHSVPHDPQPGTDAPGIFVDPRYKFNKKCLEKIPVGLFDTNGCKFDRMADPAFPEVKGEKHMLSARLQTEPVADELIAFDIASAVASKKSDLVPGNHLEDKDTAVMHYAANPPPKFPGFSLGDWGPVNVDQQDDPGKRPGAPVITVEVYHYHESLAFINGEQIYGEDARLLPPRKTPPLIPGTTVPWPFFRDRSTDLQLYAQALIDKFLEPTLS
jgi:hypothetical protein